MAGNVFIQDSPLEVDPSLKWYQNQNSSQALALLKQEKKTVKVDSSGYHSEIKVESPWPIVWTFLPTFHDFAPIHYLNLST